MKHSVANSYKANVESIFTEIYQAKSKPFIVDILYAPPGIIDFVNYIDQILFPANISMLFQRCLLVDTTLRRGTTSNQR